MITFLEEKARHICEQHRKDLSEIVIIIPNKRAAVYLQHYLANTLKKPFFSPEIITISEWVDQNIDERIVNKTELLFLLYEVHIAIEQTSAETFNDFIKWAGMILSDFDEIDRYLLNPKEVFRDLKNIKDIENWSFSDEPLSKGQENFMDFWTKLPLYYKLLEEKLNENNLIYGGKAYRNFFGKLDTIDLKTYYYFLGFNALSASEEAIIKKLVTAKKGEIHFDVDQSYLQNDEHEAGYFYREICKRWGIGPKAGNHFNETPKNIHIVEAASQVAQTKIAGTVLSQLIEENGSIQNTAVVLADESLFIPLLRSLPAEVEMANVSMGYPLRFTQLQALIDLLFEIQFEYARFGSGQLYHHSVLKLIEHPYITALIDSRQKRIDFRKEIVEKNRIYISVDEICEAFPSLSSIRLCLIQWKKFAPEGINAFRTLCDKLSQSISESTLDDQILKHFSRGITRLDQLISKFNYELDLKTFRKIFGEFFNSESLSFLGNPLSGLQVMGILETRLIDFKNVIILGMNEGILPKKNIVNSFIPWDLRRKLQLPMEEERQAIFAHHFYRLLHRCENLTLTYNSVGEGLNTAERSRYLFQIENEIDTSKGHQITYITYTPEDTSTNTAVVKYESTATVQKALDKILASKVSPSAINTLIDCSLDFYYRYILKLQEIAKVEESFEASTFGTKIHEVLDIIFRKNFLEKKKPLDVETLKSVRKEIPDLLETAYTEKGTFRKSDIAYGYNKLAFDVSVQFIEKFIDQQISEVEITKETIHIVHLEEQIRAEYEWQLGDEKKKVCFVGIADRIDRIGDHYRIIDYKSGKCDFDKIKLGKSITNPGGVENFIYHEKKRYGRQLLLYALMFRQAFPERKNFSVGIVSMVNIRDWIQFVRPTPNDPTQISEDILDGYEEALQDLLSSLYAPDFSFVHNPKAMFCEHCEK